MKKILVSLMLIAVVVGVLGTAFTAGIGWGGVGILSRGTTTLPTVGVDHMSYVISSGKYDPAALVGVTLSFDKTLSNPTIFISARSGTGVGTELAYYAGVTSGTIDKGANTTFWLYDMNNAQYSPGNDPGIHPDVSDVTHIAVTVAENSTYNTP